MTYWWSHDASERFWIEIRHMPGAGEQLTCPVVDAAGKPNPWYDLVAAVEAGDIVFHWHAREHRFVGTSYALGRAQDDGRNRFVALAGFTPTIREITLASIREAEDTLREIRNHMVSAYPANPLYLPFQYRSDGLRLMSNYFAKLPKAVVSLLFEGDEIPVSQELSGLPRISYLNPFKAKADSEYAATVPERKERRTRKHETLVNAFALWLSKQGFDVKRNAAVDLGLEEPAVIFEAKVGSSVPSIRTAVGQLYEYRFFKVADPSSAIVLLTSVPVPSRWVDYLEGDRGIGVAWQSGDGFKFSRLAEQALGL